jgi:hypothetical protein
MLTSIGKTPLAAVALAGALALGAAAPAVAGPVPTGVVALKAAVPGEVTEVRHRGAWIAGGIAAGLALGAIAASRPYYYEPYPYYDAPPSAVVYEPAPVYVDPGYAYATPVAPVDVWRYTGGWYGYGNDASPTRERQLTGGDY